MVVWAARSPAVAADVESSVMVPNQSGWCGIWIRAHRVGNRMRLHINLSNAMNIHRRSFINRNLSGVRYVNVPVMNSEDIGSVRVADNLGVGLPG
jgi:hypothetical protein